MWCQDTTQSVSDQNSGPDTANFTVEDGCRVSCVQSQGGSGVVAALVIAHQPAWVCFRTRPQQVTALAECTEQRAGLLEIRRIEAFREPFVDLREHVAGLIALTLIAPKARKAGGGTQLQ